MNAHWPSLADYVEWAQRQNCTATITLAEREGRLLQIVTIIASSGMRAVEIAMELDDPLMSTTIARLDRRLGIKSNLFR